MMHRNNKTNGDNGGKVILEHDNKFEYLGRVINDYVKCQNERMRRIAMGKETSS